MEELESKDTCLGAKRRLLSFLKIGVDTPQRQAGGRKRQTGQTDETDDYALVIFGGRPPAVGANVSHLRINLSGVFETEATRLICGFPREERAANKDRRPSPRRPAAPSISGRSYRPPSVLPPLICPPGEGVRWPSPSSLTNLFVCSSKRAHLPDFPLANRQRRREALQRNRNKTPRPQFRQAQKVISDRRCRGFMGDLLRVMKKKERSGRLAVQN